MNEVLEQFASDKLTSCFSSWDKERQRVGGWGGEDRWMGLGMGADTSGGKYHPQEKCCWDRVAETTERTVVGKMRPYLPLEGINRWSGCWGGRLSLEWKPRRALRLWSRCLEQSLAASRCSGNTCLAGALCRPDGSQGSVAEKASC